MLNSSHRQRQVGFCLINLSDWVKGGLCQKHHSRCRSSGERGATSPLLGLHLHFKSPVISSRMKEGSNFTDCMTGATRRGRRTAAWATVITCDRSTSGLMGNSPSVSVSVLFLAVVHHEIYGKHQRVWTCSSQCRYTRNSDKIVNQVKTQLNKEKKREKACHYCLFLNVLELNKSEINKHSSDWNSGSQSSFNL